MQSIAGQWGERILKYIPLVKVSVARELVGQTAMGANAGRVTNSKKWITLHRLSGQKKHTR